MASKRAKPWQAKSPGPPRAKASVSAFEDALDAMRKQAPSAFPNVSVRWLLGAVAAVFVAALVGAWLLLCLLYWQGNWQLLYHPQTALARTPSRLGLPFERVRFAADETGKPQLSGWWIPAGGPPERPANLTVLYLHDGNGNLSDTLETLAFFHRQGLAVFAIDYRAYGESALLHSGSHPSEKQFRQDAEWSLSWLTVTRQLNPARIVVAGSGLGSSIAASLAADHNELAGVILDEPNDDPLRPIFSDPRSRLVPAHWLVADHYDLKAATDQIRIPSLWIISPTRKAEAGNALKAYQACASRKSLTWLTGNRTENSDVGDALRRWLDEL